jgi:phosphatidylserine decarboxylase
MIAHSRSMVVREGWPWLLGAAALTVGALRLDASWWAAIPAMVTVWLYFLFRDPGREVPALPLAVFAPVDGRVIDVAEVRDADLQGHWWRIRLATNHLGAYTVRAPIEGQVLDLREADRSRNGASGLWVRSEEGDEVAVLFGRRRLGLAPRAFVRYGERVGQGQRFAYLRLAAEAIVYLPATARPGVQAGDRVEAGTSVLAELIRR